MALKTFLRLTPVIVRGSILLRVCITADFLYAQTKFSPFRRTCHICLGCGANEALYATAASRNAASLSASTYLEEVRKSNSRS